MGIFEKPTQENPNDGIDQEKAGEDARKSLAREMQRQLTDEEIKKAQEAGQKREEMGR